MTALTVENGVCLDLVVAQQSALAKDGEDARTDHGRHPAWEETLSCHWPPPSAKHLRLRNSGVVTSSLRWASHDSCNVSISSLSSSFCSSLSFAIRLLVELGRDRRTLNSLEAALVASLATDDLGWPKKDVILVRISKANHLIHDSARPRLTQPV